MRAIINNERVLRIVGRGHDLTVDEVGRQISSSRLRSLTQFIEQDFRTHKADVRHGNVPPGHTSIADKRPTRAIDTHCDHRIRARTTQDAYLSGHVSFKWLVSSIGHGL